MELPLKNRQPSFTSSTIDRQTRKEISNSIDEQVIPAIRNNNKIKEFPGDLEGVIGGGINDNNSQEADKLTEDNIKFAELLMPVLGEDICKKLFSKTWALREEAMRMIYDDLKGETRSTKIIQMNDNNALFIAVIGAISYTVNDKIGQVCQKSMSTLILLMERQPLKISSRNELMGYIENTINGILEKVGDNNVRIREQAEQSFMAMARNSIVSCNSCVNLLVKQSTSTAKNKTINSTRHVIAKLGLLKQIIKEFNINNTDVPFSPVVDYAVKNLENSNADIRTASLNIIVDIYSLVGSKLKSLLSGIRPNQMETLQKEFDIVDETSANQGDPEEDEAIVATNINHHENKQANKGTSAKKEGKSINVNSTKGPKSGKN